ncbi:MAG: hypothetical protein WDN75_15000 [Bacteroidota bacterium]
MLVDALRKLGVTIDYKGKEGFPPIETKGFGRQLTDRISIRGDVSSQFISALMMVAPALPMGLTIDLEGKVGSLPYLEMTAELMALFGIKPEMSAQQIRIASGHYKPAFYRVEPDWSAASYWFGFTALAAEADILLPRVDSVALQGDRVIVDIMKQLEYRLTFKKMDFGLQNQILKPMCLSGIFPTAPILPKQSCRYVRRKIFPANLPGWESLRIKETDRISALQAEAHQDRCCPN